MKNFIDFEKLQRLSEADKQNEIKTNSSKSAEGTIEAVIEETCDVINVAIDILNSIEIKYPDKSEYIAKRFQEKLDKWESKVETNKQPIVDDTLSEDVKFIGNLISNSKITITKG